MEISIDREIHRWIYYAVGLNERDKDGRMGMVTRLTRLSDTKALLRRE